MPDANAYLSLLMDQSAGPTSTLPHFNDDLVGTGCHANARFQALGTLTEALASRLRVAELRDALMAARATSRPGPTRRSLPSSFRRLRQLAHETDAIDKYEMDLETVQGLQLR